MTRRRDSASRVEARGAALRLQLEHPHAEVRPVRLRYCDGLEAVIGAERVAGTIGEVEDWLGEQALRGEDRPGSSPAGQDHERKDG